MPNNKLVINKNFDTNMLKIYDSKVTGLKHDSRL